MDNVEQNANFSTGSSGIGQFRFNPDPNEVANSRSSVPSMLSDMMPMDSGGSRGISQPAVMFPTSAAHGLEFSDYQQLQSRSQLSLNVGGDLSALPGASQPLMAPSGVGRLFLSSGMDCLNRMDLPAGQPNGIGQNSGIPAGLPPSSNVGPDQRFLANSVPLLPAHSHNGQQLVQSNCAAVSSPFDSLNHVNMPTSIMSSRLSSAPLPGYRNVSLAPVGPLTMLNFPNVLSVPQGAPPDGYRHGQVSEAGVGLALHGPGSHGYVSSQTPSVGTQSCVPVTATQRYDDLSVKTSAAPEEHNAGLIQIQGSPGHRYQEKQQMGCQRQEQQQVSQKQLDQQQQLNQQLQHQQLNQQQQLGQQQQQQVNQQQLDQQQSQQQQQISQQQQQLPPQHHHQQQQQQLDQLQSVDPLMCKADPSASGLHQDQQQNPGTSSATVAQAFDNISSLDDMASPNSGPSTACAQSSPLGSDEQQPGPSSESSSGSKSKVFYHKVTGKNVRIPSGNEAAAAAAAAAGVTASSQNDSEEAPSSLIENSPAPGPSQSYSSPMFEPLSPPDSTTNISVSDFLDLPMRSSAHPQAPSSSTRQQPDHVSGMTYKEDNDGVSSTSEDHHLELLMQSRIDQSATVHQQQQQQFQVSPGSVSCGSSHRKGSGPQAKKARDLDGVNHQDDVNQLSPKDDVSTNDDANMPSSSGILHPSEYEPISDEEERSSEISSRGRVSTCHVSNDNLVSSCENLDRARDLDQMPTGQQFFNVDLNSVGGADIPERDVPSGSRATSMSRSESGLCNMEGSINLPQDISRNFFCNDTNQNVEEGVSNSKEAEDHMEVTSCQTGNMTKLKEFQSIDAKQHQELFNHQDSNTPQPNSSNPDVASSGSSALQGSEQSDTSRNVQSTDLNGIQFLLKKGTGDAEPTPGPSGLQFMNKKLIQDDKTSDHGASPLPAPIENDVNLAEGMKAENADDDAMNLDKLNTNPQSSDFNSSEEMGSKSQDHSEMAEICSDPEDGENLGMHNLDSQLIQEGQNEDNEQGSESSAMVCVDEGNVLESGRNAGEERGKDMLLPPVIVTNDDLDVSDSTIETQTGGQALNFRIHIDDSQCVFIDGQRRWKCLLCPKKYTSKHNLVSHILDHNGIKPFHCNICGKYFKQAGHLYQHILTHGNIKPYMCKYCDRCFTQGSHLKRHLAVHMEKRPNVCAVCDRGFVYPSELKSHMEKHAVGVQYPCDHCGDSFDSAKKLKQHLASNHGNVADLTCKECGKVFPYPSQLRDHMIKHSGKRPFQCGECGTYFLKEHHLKAHQFTHTGLRPFVCEICSRAFNQKANLQRHMLIHQNERNYKCEVCSRTFSQPQVLKAHMVTHADDKPYHCEVCGKKFTRAHNLNGHMHMHKGTKPHVCFCGASFTLKGNLNRHKKEKHGITDITKTTEEEAAKILNEMSSRKVYDGSTETDGTGDSYEGTPPPKKKRKSLPPRKTLTQIAQDAEVEAFWDEHPPTSEDNVTTAANHIVPNVLPMTTTAMETFTTDVINKLMGSMTGEYAPPGNRQTIIGLPEGQLIGTPVTGLAMKSLIKNQQDNRPFSNRDRQDGECRENNRNLGWQDKFSRDGKQEQPGKCQTT